MLCAVVLPDCGATLAWHTAGDCYRIVSVSASWGDCAGLVTVPLWPGLA